MKKTLFIISFLLLTSLIFSKTITAPIFSIRTYAGGIFLLLKYNGPGYSGTRMNGNDVPVLAIHKNNSNYKSFLSSLQLAFALNQKVTVVYTDEKIFIEGACTVTKIDAVHIDNYNL